MGNECVKDTRYETFEASKFILEDGSIYYGPVKGNKPHGKGRIEKEG